MFFVSQLYFSLKQDEITQEVVEQETREFGDTISQHGEISETTLTQYYKRIANTSNLYNVELVHEKLNLEPEYRFKTADEIIADKDAAYTGENIYTYRDVISNPVDVVQQEPDDLTMNSETNQSVMNSSTKTGASSSHVHTSTCSSSSGSGSGHIHTGSKENLPSNSHYYTSGCLTHHYRRGVAGYSLTSGGSLILPSSAFEITYPNHTVNSILTAMKQDGPSSACAFPQRISFRANATNSMNGNSTLQLRYNYNLSQETNGAFVYVLYSVDVKVYSYADWASFGMDFVGKTPQRLTLDEMIHAVNDLKSFVEASWQSQYTLQQATPVGIYFSDAAPYVACTDSITSQMLKDDIWYTSCNQIGQNYTTSVNDSCSGHLVHTGDGILAYSNIITVGAENWNTAVRVAQRKNICSVCGKKYSVISLMVASGQSYEYAWIVEGDIHYPNEVLQQVNHYYNTNFTGEEVWSGWVDRVKDAFALYFDNYLFANDIPYVKIAGSAYESYVGYYPTTTTVTTPNLGTVSVTYYIPIVDGYFNNGSYVSRPAPHYRFLPGKFMCDKIIKSIIPTHPIQNLYVGDQDHFITTATIVYLNGSTEVAICNSNFLVNTVGYNQIATITYYGLKSATEYKTFSATIIVNVIAKNKTCVHGHTYWLSNNGSDPGCPFCKAWLRGLALVVPSSGYLEIYQGTTLESNGVKLLATYYDGHQEYVTTGYHDNLDHTYIGVETVTIGYKGKYVSLQVKVLRKLKQCSICHRFYELYPDGSDPGCPYCLSLIPVFTGNIMKYYTEYTTEEILEEINTKGSYLLNKGDEISIQVNNKSETFASKILSFLGIRMNNAIKVWTANEVRDAK